MRTSLRTALGALLTTVVVLSVPVASLATPAVAAPEKAVPAARHYSPAEATAIFERLQAARSPKRLAPRELGNPLPRRDLSLLMRDAQLAKSSMTARQASIIDSNNRPVDDSVGCQSDTVGGVLGVGARTWDVVESAHFCIHYTPTTSLSASNGGATPTQAQTTANTMEYVFAKEVAGLAFNPPLRDSDNLYDVFLDQIGDEGYYGFCTTETGTTLSTAWCGLDNDFSVNEFGAPPLNSLRVTAAHEFFHAIQFAYDAGEDDWFMEGTAVWMEDQVYPAINDYLQYLNFSQLRNWKQSADFAGSLHRYGTVIFWKFLSERYKDVNIIRQVWNSARVSAGSRRSVAAVAAVLKAKGSSLPVEFARYGVWNTLGAGTYADRSKFPIFQASGCNNVRWCAWAGGTLTRSSRDTGTLSVKLNHLSTAPLILRTGSTLPTRSKLRISVNGPDTSRGTQARVQIRFKSGRVTTYVIPLNSLGNGSKVVGFNRTYVSSAIVTLSNGSAGFNSQAFNVRSRALY
ncbi:MAG: DUF6055 domain-containing protein [Propionibacteriales bacterium]|nr:DUF6055 domain-containing protein [Propionibacteriales bacterium]